MNFFIRSGILLLSSLFASQPSLAGCAFPNTAVIPNNPDSFYTDNNDGTISDNNTGLMWEKCLLGLSGDACEIGKRQDLSWDNAMATAKTAVTGNYSDWRLPNKNELASLFEYSCLTRPINETFFPGPTAATWSSTPYAGTSDTIWIATYNDGGQTNAVNGDKSRTFAVRLVRGMQ